MKLGHNIICTTSQEAMSPSIGRSDTLVCWDQQEEQRHKKEARLFEKLKCNVDSVHIVFIKSKLLDQNGFSNQFS